QSKRYGGAGKGSSGDILLTSRIQKAFLFDGSSEDWSVNGTLDTYCAQFEEYGPIAMNDMKQYSDLIEGKTFQDTIRASGGTWILVGREGGSFDTARSFAYVIPNNSGYAATVSNAWVDGRYVNAWEHYEPGAHFSDHPDANIVITKMQYTDKNGKEHIQDVLFLYKQSQDIWQASGYTYYGTNVDVPSIFTLTREQVLQMQADANTDKYPESGLIYDGTVYPGTPFPVAATQVKLNKSSAAMSVGDTKLLSATALPNYAAGLTFAWKSSDEAVALVDETGQVTAVGVGEAEITATALIGGQSAACRVTVVPKAAANDLVRSEISVKAYGLQYYFGSYKTPEVSVWLNGEELVKDRDFEVTYQDNMYPGTATVTVRGIGEYTGSASTTFEIGKGRRYLWLTGTSSHLVPMGGTKQFSFSGDEEGKLEYISSNESVATVDADGTVHGISEGYAILAVNAAETDLFQSASTAIAIQVVRDQKNLEQCEINLLSNYYTYNGQPKEPEAEVICFGRGLTKGKDFEISYANNILPGTATAIIQGIGEYSGTKELTFTVWKAYQYISLTSKEGGFLPGQSGKIEANAATNLVYSSSDPNIATVDADGTIHAIAVGEAEITITAEESELYYSREKTFTVIVYPDNKQIEKCTITVENYYWLVYTGSPIEPEITVTYFTHSLEQDKDYTVSYRDNVEPGTAVVIVRGIGEYNGITEKTFTIRKAYAYIYFNYFSSKLETGSLTQLQVNTREDTKITFTSSNEEVAVVDADGILHALSEGTAVITAFSEETSHYEKSNCSKTITVSKDVHSMTEVEVVYADENNPVATVTRRCSVCGKEESESFTTLSSLRYVWYWHNGRGTLGIAETQTEGDSYGVDFGGGEPSDAENTELELVSSDPAILKVDGKNFTFVGTGTVTLEIRVKYRPDVKLTRTITVEHNYEVDTVEEPSTCTKQGRAVYKCSVCGATETKALPVDPENHVGGTHLENASAATCGAEGYSGDICCDECDEVLTYGEVLPATGEHVWGEAYIVDRTPTCSEEGEESIHCTVCEAKKDARSIPKAEHSWDAGRIIKPATATEPGTVVYSCTECGEERQEIVPVLTPTQGPEPTEEPTPTPTVTPEPTEEPTPTPTVTPEPTEEPTPTPT
ncbi:MAG: Ig-like domain-containing protein, partial [Lachnospiraceae bacterium]